MPDVQIVATLEGDRLLSLAGLIAGRAQDAVDATAEAIRAAAADAAAKDTGSMAAGLYVATPQGSDYAARAAEAAALNPKATIVDEVDRPEAGSATVAGAAGHSLYLELGTVHMAAQPFLGPAAEGERDAFLERLAAAVEGA